MGAGNPAPLHGLQCKPRAPEFSTNTQVVCQVSLIRSRRPDTYLSTSSKQKNFQKILKISNAFLLNERIAEDLSLSFKWLFRPDHLTLEEKQILPRTSLFRTTTQPSVTVLPRPPYASGSLARQTILVTLDWWNPTYESRWPCSIPRSAVKTRYPPSNVLWTEISFKKSLMSSYSTREFCRRSNV